MDAASSGATRQVQHKGSKYLYDTYIGLAASMSRYVCTLDKEPSRKRLGFASYSCAEVAADHRKVGALPEEC